MADPLNIDEIQKRLEKQIADLRKEVTRLSKSNSEKGIEMLGDAADHVSEIYNTASSRGSRAAQQLKTRANAVAEVARENPGTATTVVGMVGLFGFIVGVLVGYAAGGSYRR